MSSRTIGFAVAEEDLERLGRLTEKFGKGNRSAFLREAMRQMETVERAERLAGLQAYGAERSAAAGLSPGGSLVESGETVVDCIDFEDNRILECAAASGSVLIVSDDHHLISMSPWRGTAIVNCAEFVKRTDVMRRARRG